MKITRCVHKLRTNYYARAILSERWSSCRAEHKYQNLYKTLSLDYLRRYANSKYYLFFFRSAAKTYTRFDDDSPRFECAHTCVIVNNTLLYKKYCQCRGESKEISPITDHWSRECAPTIHVRAYLNNNNNNNTGLSREKAVSSSTRGGSCDHAVSLEYNNIIFYIISLYRSRNVSSKGPPLTTVHAYSDVLSFGGWFFECIRPCMYVYMYIYVCVYG